MGTSAHDFLAWILPDEGFYCATIVRSDTGAKYNKHFATTDELADFILNSDRRGDTAYHACASFLTSENRKGANVSKVQAFWLDVDAGEGKPYPDAASAAIAVSNFVRETALPVPLYVGSGRGIHVYWPLDEALAPDIWKTYATRLKQLSDRYHLEVDRTRTSDLASILRTPGTHNRKGGGNRLVECGPLVGPYSLEQFGALNANQGNWTQREGGDGNGNLSRRMGTGTSSPFTSRPATRLIDRALNLWGEPDADPDLVAERCAQLAAVKANPGQNSEPIIYGVLGVMGHCRQGAENARTWFAPEWHAEVDKKLAQQEAFGPTTCAHFESLNPKGCKGCPFKGKITSPIQLGRRQWDRMALETKQENTTFGTSRSETPETQERPALPLGFVINEFGLCHEREDKNGDLTTIQISAHPIVLQSVQTSEVDDHSFSLVFGLSLPRGQRTITIGARTFFSNSGISEITGQGAIIHEGDLFKKYVRLAVDEWHRNKDVDLRYDQFGWKNDDTAFLWGRRLYTSNSVRPVVGSTEVEHRSQYLEPARGGSLERWSAAANQLFAAGLEPQSFGLLCAFAAPLMRFHTREEGGAIVSFVSDQSGSGKTTTLEAAASVWGRLKGTKLADNDTKVAQGLKLGVMGNLPCTYDEMASKDPDIIRQFVLMFTSGQDKDRGKSDGTLIHAKSEWQTILLLASNKPLVDILSNLDGTDAPAYRLLEFNADLPTGTDTRRGDAIRRELAANSGYAGDAFLRIILQPEILGFIRRSLPTCMDNIWARTALKSQHRFWVRTIASVVAAGTIVQRYGIIDFSMQRISDWVLDYVSKRADFSVVTGARTETDILGDFLSRNWKNMLVVPHAWRPKVHMQPRVIPKDNLFIRYEQQEQNLFVLETELRNYLLKNGKHLTQTILRLKEKGILKSTGKRVTMGAGTEYASGQSVCYHIDMGHPAMGGLLREVQTVIDNEMWKDTKEARENRRIDALGERRK